MVNSPCAQRLRRTLWAMALLCYLAGIPASGQAPLPHATRITVSAARPHSFEQDTLNIRIFRWVNDHHTPVLDRLFSAYVYLGSGWVLIPVVLFAWWRRRRLLSPLLIAVSVETILVTALKQIYQQPRPLVQLAHVHALVHLHNASFPSGDAAMAFAIASVMLDREHWAVQAAWLLYALLIAYERMYVGVHFPLDVTVGTLIGLLCARVTLAVMKTRMRSNAQIDGEK